MTDIRTLTPLEAEALQIRHNAALRVLRSDPELTPEEALMKVIVPSAAVLEASLAKAREVMRERTMNRVRRELERDRAGCSGCGADVDDEGYCVLCGVVTLDGGLV